MLKRYNNFLRLYSQLFKKSKKYNSNCFSEYDKCRFCKGTGKIRCFKCDIYYVKENWTEKKCTKCVNGVVRCCFCGGNGKSHQIF